MKKTTPIGTSDFKDIINENLLYIDKSLLIKEIAEDTSRIILLPRPRRFGKTLNMSMLRYFFDLNNAKENRKLFEGLKITNDAVFDLYQGKFPVISISFKDAKSNCFEDIYAKICRLIGAEFAKHRYILDAQLLDETNQEEFRAIASYKANRMQIEDSLLKLSEYLSAYYKQKTIILIDEYDTPIHSAFTNKYYTEMIDFMRSLLGAALKDNVHLQKGVLTGTLRISKESIFTGFNNPSVYTILNSEFSQCFGFTPEELREILVYYEIENLEPEIKNWYNGYIFGSQEIYNPWSILKFVASKDKRFIAHWVNTSSNDLIKELIIDSPASVRSELYDLLNGKPLIKKLNENISFPELKLSDGAIFSFLVFSGYLKARVLKFEDRKYWYELSIPNEEVKEMFETIIMNWIQDSFENNKYTELLKALTSGDIPTFEVIMNDFVINALSFHHVQKPDVERVYQAFTLGMLVSLSNRYEVLSEKESGFGRYDIALIPVDKTKKSIIMEFKRIIELQNETKDTALASALQQIEDKQYETAIRQRGYHDIVKLAVVFDGKRVWVKKAMP